MSYDKLSIKSWSEADRPREKMAKRGAHSLTNSELLAIIIGSGNTTQSAVELSKQILASCGHKLSSLSQLSIQELLTFKGIGQAKAISILAALELSRRKSKEIQHEKPIITSSMQAYDWMKHDLEGLDHEQFWVLFLNQANKIIQSYQISKGGITATVVDPKIIFNQALLVKATGLILFHNHPSGTVKPSKSDIELTQKIKKGANILEITLLDHLIIGQNSYFSFADEQKL